MPAQCEICGKQRQVANRVSHSNIKTKSIQQPICSECIFWWAAFANTFVFALAVCVRAR